MPVPAASSRQDPPEGRLDLFEQSQDTALRNEALVASLQREWIEVRKHPRDWQPALHAAYMRSR